MFSQGDKEEGLGLAVSPFCNRANMNMPKAQINFIEIFLKVSPYVTKRNLMMARVEITCSNLSKSGWLFCRGCGQHDSFLMRCT